MWPNTLINPTITLNQTSTGSPTNQWSLDGAGNIVISSNSKSLNLGNDFLPETLDDSDSDGYYSPIPQLNQSSLLHPANFLKGLVDGLETTFNSRMHSWIADWTDRVTRPLFPNLFPPQKTNLEKMMERVEKDVEKKESKAPIDLELDDEGDPGEKPSGNCSCALGKQSSITVDQSDQRGSTIGTESDVTGSGMHGREVDASKQSSNMKVASDAGPVTAPEIGQTTNRVEEWKRSTSESSSGNRVTLPFDPAPPPVTPDTPGVNIQPDTPPKPPSPSTLEHPILPPPAEGKSESSQDPDSNKQNSKSGEGQVADYNQNSKGTGVVMEQFPVIGAQGSVTVGNDLAPPLQPIDHVNSGQQPPFTSGRSESQQPPLMALNPPTLTALNPPTLTALNPPTLTTPTTDNQQTIDDRKGEDKCDLLGQAGGKTETNQQNNFDPSDLLLPGILVGVGGLIVIGLIVSSNKEKKNKQSEARPEVSALPNPKLNEKTKPPPPSLYSIQPQGDTAGTRIF